MVTAVSYHNLPIRNLHTTNYNPAQVPSLDIAEFCAPVIHPTTGEVITRYQILAKDKELSDTCTTAFGKEFGGLAQGDNRTGQ